MENIVQKLLPSSSKITCNGWLEVTTGQLSRTALRKTLSLTLSLVGISSVFSVAVSSPQQLSDWWGVAFREPNTLSRSRLLCVWGGGGSIGTTIQKTKISVVYYTTCTRYSYCNGTYRVVSWARLLTLDEHGGFVFPLVISPAPPPSSAHVQPTPSQQGKICIQT